MFASATAHLEVFDPGLVRTRRGVRAVGATVLAWATMLTITAVFDVADPARITLFAAGAAFEGALLAPDPRPRDRVRTLGWAAVVCAAAVVATVHLTLVASWLAAVALVILMFSSYALRPWSIRVAGLALMGAITVYITGGGHITVGRLGWFALASAIGFGWLAIWESVILRDEPLHSLQRSVQVFALRISAAVTGVMGVLNTVRDGTPSDRAREALRADLDRVRACRAAIERQSPGAVESGLGNAEADHLRVALYSAEKALQDMVVHVDEPGWVSSLPDEMGWSITSTLFALSLAVRDDRDEESRAVAVRTAQVLRSHLHDALTRATAPGAVPSERPALHAALTLLSGGEVIAQSITQAKTLTTPSSAAGDPGRRDGPPPAESPMTSVRNSPSPSMALAIQAVVAAVTAGVIATLLGNDQRLVVAWTAFVIIAGSAGLSTRRALVRIPATILGAASGVLLAATVPDTVGWTVTVVAVGVFFTIVSAPVSYPAMVFWMSIAFVPLFASEGRYLDLIWDKTTAALIGGCVAAVVTLTVVPIRSAGQVRPALLRYLTALDTALASHLPGAEHRAAVADAELDCAHAALTATVATAAAETNVFAQSQNAKNESAAQVDAVHSAYQRLTPLLSDSARLLNGWSDARVEQGIRRLRDAIECPETSTHGEADRLTGLTESMAGADGAASLGLSDSLRYVENLHAALTHLAATLDGRPSSR